MGFFKSLFSGSSSEEDNQLKVTKRHENNIYFRGKGLNYDDTEKLMNQFYALDFLKETTSYDFYLTTPSDAKKELNFAYVMKNAEVSEEEKNNFLMTAGILYKVFPSSKITSSIVDANLNETNRLGLAIRSF